MTIAEIKELMNSDKPVVFVIGAGDTPSTKLIERDNIGKQVICVTTDQMKELGITMVEKPTIKPDTFILKKIDIPEIPFQVINKTPDNGKFYDHFYKKNKH